MAASQDDINGSTENVKMIFLLSWTSTEIQLPYDIAEKFHYFFLRGIILDK